MATTGQQVYDFRSGRSIKGLHAQTIGLELERLRAVHGTLTPQLVLAAAEDPESPLHEGFTWDNDAAGRRLRLIEAGRLIVSIRVVNGPIQTSVPVYVSVRTPERGREFVPTYTAMTDDEIKARVLLSIREHIEGLERRYSNFRAVGELLERVKSNVG